MRMMGHKQPSKFKPYLNKEQTIAHWLKISEQYKGSSSPSGQFNKDDIICIEKDIPRAFPSSLTNQQRQQIKIQIIYFLEDHPQISYRGGTMVLFAFVNRLTQNNTQAVVKILSHLFFAPTHNLSEFFMSHTRVQEVNSVFQRLIQREFPNIYKVIQQGYRFFCYSGIATLHLSKADLDQDFDRLIAAWNLILETNIYACIQIYLAIFRKTNPTTFEQLLQVKISSLSPQQILEIKVREPAYYEEHIYN